MDAGSDKIEEEEKEEEEDMSPRQVKKPRRAKASASDPKTSTRSGSARLHALADMVPTDSDSPEFARGSPGEAMHNVLQISGLAWHQEGS